MQEAVSAVMGRAFIGVGDLGPFGARHDLEDGFGTQFLEPQCQRQPPSVFACAISTPGTTTNGRPSAINQKRNPSSRVKSAAITSATRHAVLTMTKAQPCQVLGVAPNP